MLLRRRYIDGGESLHLRAIVFAAATFSDKTELSIDRAKTGGASLLVPLLLTDLVGMLSHLQAVGPLENVDLVDDGAVSEDDKPRLRDLAF